MRGLQMCRRREAVEAAKTMRRRSWKRRERLDMRKRGERDVDADRWDYAVHIESHEQAEEVEGAGSAATEPDTDGNDDTDAAAAAAGSAADIDVALIDADSDDVIVAVSQGRRKRTVRKAML